MPFTGRAHPVQGAEVAKGIVDYGNEVGIQTEGKRRPCSPLVCLPHGSHCFLTLLILFSHSLPPSPDEGTVFCKESGR